MRIVGIDNGLDGGLVLIDSSLASTPELQYHGLAVAVTPTVIVRGSKREYDANAIVERLKLWKPNHVYLEKAQAMPGQGVTSMFSIGQGYGLYRGILSALKIPYTLVHPKTWQKDMFRDQPKTDTKAMSFIVCSRIWPSVSWLATPRCKKPHDGLTDAALIAAYGQKSGEAK